jgi:aspartate/methionine/tyrosine aminotransferase
VLPGTAFGQGGKGFIRLAYTQADADLERGLERIDKFVRSAT